jgi:inorganic triphosphatase YgiF
MSDPVEVELKLEYDPADRERLLASPLLGAGGGQSLRLIATYFDTPDLRLNKAGYSLRIRTDGKKRVQTVKASSSKAAGLFVRGEWNRPIRSDRPILDEKAGPLGQSLDAAALAGIAPMFVTDIERRTGPIRQDGTLIEYAIDSGEVRAGQHALPLFELELELKQGSSQILFDLARALNEHVPLRLGVRSKSVRGYALVKGAPATSIKADPIRLDPELGAAEAFATIAGECIRHYRMNEALVLDHGGVEAVHQARVGLRRLRSAFSLFGPLFAHNERAALLKAELRWLAGELGMIRDMDVLIPRLDEAAGGMLARVRGDSLAHVRSLLESNRVRMLPIDIAEWLAIGRWQEARVDGEERGNNVLAFAGDRLDRLRKRIRRHGDGLADLDDAHRHQVRRDAKKLRYAAEFFVSLYPGRKPRRRLDHLLDRLEMLQDKLGQLNDIAAGPELLARHGLDIAMPSPGKRERKPMLADAQDSFEELMDVKRFWRT